MPLRPAKCYRDIKKKPANTRVAVKVHKRNYIGAIPGLKIRQFNMGNPLKEFHYIIDLIAENAVFVRDNAIEAVRTTVNRHLHKKIGKDSYFLKIRVFPYQILRENKQAQGAGADRVTKGMSHPFGKPIGRAVKTRKGMILMSLLVDEANLELGKKSFERIKSKLPCKTSVKVHTDTKSIGTKPRKTREEKTIEKAEETAQTGKETAQAEGSGAEGKKEATKEEKKK